jgi:hypothetical protein
MHLKKGLCALGLGLVCAAGAQAAVVVEYNTTGAPSSGTLPVTWAATTTSGGVSAMDLSRGAGITAAGLGNGFSSDHWGVDNGGTWAGNKSYADALAADDYFQWGFTVDSSHTVSLSTLDLAMRRSAVAAPDRFELYSSTDGFATAGTLAASWTYLGRSSTGSGTVTPYQWMTTDTPNQGNGNPISTQDLSGVTMLQNIAPGSTVTFRLYGWYDGTGSPANSNTVALGRASATDPITSGGPSLGGTVLLVPEPASMGLVGLAGGLLAVRRRNRK